jgi:hypothetical protein
LQAKENQQQLEIVAGLESKVEGLTRELKHARDVCLELQSKVSFARTSDALSVL